MNMALIFHSRRYSLFTLTLLLFIFMSGFVFSQSPLNVEEQEAVYMLLESLSGSVSWRSDYPDDLCSSAPHGVVCDFFAEDEDPASNNDTAAASGEASLLSAHVTELSFGYVSDYSSNPPCSSTANLDPSFLTPFRHLRKLFFYECFTQTPFAFPDFPSSLSSSIEELIFIDNPALVGAISGSIRNFRNLRRLVLSGTNVSGNIPSGFDFLSNLEQVTLSRNKLSGVVPGGLGELQKLKILDLSQNSFEGNIPEDIGNLTQLLKLDLSFNNFCGKIPENFKNMKALEFLDLSYNKLGSFGVPLFLGELRSLKEVYLTGNYLGGVIPEIWENLGGVLGIGLSGTGLVGKIPASMGVNLRNACYIGLDNNKLEGTVPGEFEALKFVNELNLESNNLSGKLPFSAKFVSKLKWRLKLKGNPQLCVDEVLRSAKVGPSIIGQLKLCSQEDAIFKAAHISHGTPPTLPYVSCFSMLLLGLLFLFH